MLLTRYQQVQLGVDAGRPLEGGSGSQLDSHKSALEEALAGCSQSAEQLQSQLASLSPQAGTVLGYSVAVRERVN